MTFDVGRAFLLVLKKSLRARVDLLSNAGEEDLAVIAPALVEVGREAAASSTAVVATISSSFLSSSPLTGNVPRPTSNHGRGREIEVA